MDLETAKTAGLVLLAVLLVGGVLLAMVIRKIIGKILVLVLAVAAAGSVYSQRSGLSDQVCQAEGHFFGVSVSIPADMRAGCTRITS
ncbi:MAG: hypothetical protein ACXVGN_10235 [Mycobacteriaceae bacterium]|jgi:predicted membrane protein